MILPRSGEHWKSERVVKEAGKKTKEAAERRLQDVENDDAAQGQEILREISSRGP